MPATAFPLPQDYNEAIQNPQTSFVDPELRGGAAAVNSLGMPLPCSGNFADVYRLTCPTTRRSWAVKCFTRQIPGIKERYQQISLSLKRAKLPFVVKCTFLDQGIRVRGTCYPVLKMPWVEGFTLNQFVKGQLARPRRLGRICRAWVRLAGRLREAGIAHCDLQHGNVLLVWDSEVGSLSVKLVDYDGMWVPALASHKSIEMGHPAYQHPQRLREGTYSPEVDRFSHLVIYTAVRALMVGGRQLWERYANGDNLLFRQQDFQVPGKSALFQELLRADDPDVRRLAEALKWAALQPLERTPLLDDLVGGNQPAPPVRAPVRAPSRPLADEDRARAVQPHLPHLGELRDEFDFRASEPDTDEGSGWTERHRRDDRQRPRLRSAVQPRASLGLLAFAIVFSLATCVVAAVVLIAFLSTKSDQPAPAVPAAEKALQQTKPAEPKRSVVPERQAAPKKPLTSP